MSGSDSPPPFIKHQVDQQCTDDFAEVADLLNPQTSNVNHNTNSYSPRWEFNAVSGDDDDDNNNNNNKNNNNNNNNADDDDDDDDDGNGNGNGNGNVDDFDEDSNDDDSGDSDGGDIGKDDSASSSDDHDNDDNNNEPPLSQLDLKRRAQQLLAEEDFHDDVAIENVDWVQRCGLRKASLDEMLCALISDSELQNDVNSQKQLDESTIQAIFEKIYGDIRNLNSTKHFSSPEVLNIFKRRRKSAGRFHANVNFYNQPELLGYFLLKVKMARGTLNFAVNPRGARHEWCGRAATGFLSGITTLSDAVKKNDSKPDPAFSRWKTDLIRTLSGYHVDPTADSGKSAHEHMVRIMRTFEDRMMGLSAARQGQCRDRQELQQPGTNINNGTVIHNNGDVNTTNNYNIVLNIHPKTSQEARILVKSIYFICDSCEAGQGMFPRKTLVPVSLSANYSFCTICKKRHSLSDILEQKLKYSFRIASTAEMQDPNTARVQMCTSCGCFSIPRYDKERKKLLIDPVICSCAEQQRYFRFYDVVPRELQNLSTPQSISKCLIRNIEDHNKEMLARFGECDSEQTPGSTATNSTKTAKSDKQKKSATKKSATSTTKGSAGKK